MSKNKVIFTRALICDANHLILPMNAQCLLSGPEQARLSNMQHAQQAKLFLLGRYLSRQLLALALQQAPELVHIHVDSKGKPQLLEPDWHFNISHSGSLLALAFGNQGPLGIDVESRRLSSAQIQRLARRYFATDEQIRLSQTDNSDRFLQLWTIKEAVLKAHGGGIANNLNAVHWQPFEDIAHFNDTEYQLHQYCYQQSRVTLALNHTKSDAKNATTKSTCIELLNVSDLPFELEIIGPQPNLDIQSFK